MRKFTIVILLALIAIHFCDCMAQKTLTVSKPLLEIQGENLVIKYDIINSDPGEKYNISLRITDSRGSKIDAQLYSGDIGDNIEGGENKRIVWQYSRDNVKDEVEIYVTIILKKYPKEPQKEELTKPAFFATRTGLVIQSVALPGLGLSRIKGKPYWPIGIGGYGMVAGAVIFNQASKSNFNNSTKCSPDEIDYYVTKSNNQKTLSLVCAIGASAIWVTDIVLVLRASANQENPAGNARNTSFRLLPEYNLAFKAPAITLKYTF